MVRRLFSLKESAEEIMVRLIINGRYNVWNERLGNQEYLRYKEKLLRQGEDEHAKMPIAHLMAERLSGDQSAIAVS